MEAILKEFLQSESPKWTTLLTTKAGFRADEAGKFVQTFGRRIGTLLRGGDLSKLLDIRELRAKLDVASLAAQVGVDAAKVNQALDTLLPELVGSLRHAAGGAEGLLGKFGGRAEGALGKLFGK